MRLPRHLAIAVVVGLLALFMPAPARAATASDVERALLDRINAGRSAQGRAALRSHAGLKAIARGWSKTMAASNDLDHGNAGARVANTSPVVAESNGNPDDGFAGWCENIAWNSLAQSTSADQVAQMFYNQWFNSTSGHKECMLSLNPTNFGQNVAGVGVFYDSADGRWWATLDAAKDNNPPDPNWVRYEQSSSTVTSSGTWTTHATPAVSGGSYGRSTTTGSSSRFSFTGNGVRWIGMKGSTGGDAEVRLDGGPPQIVDLYAANTRFGMKLYERTGLANASHTLEVAVRGTRNGSSNGFRVWVDAFERRK
ncbi:MAG: CAP domain-containing protein [Actinomycetota bacterium]